jgi:4'-phosphopantetheinyl transferase EntD
MNLTSDAVAGLFPLPVAAAVLPVSDTYRAWSEDEAAVVARAVPRRRDEFLSGRAAARVALAGAGFDPVAVPRGGRGAPVWPDGALGTIGHAGGWCVAVVVARAEVAGVRGVGVDIHSAGSLHDRAVRDRVLTRRERASASADSDADVVFAAKEAVFKAVNPATGRWLEHHDVEIDVGDGTFAVRRPVDLEPHLSGRWRAVETFVLAGCVLR